MRISLPHSLCNLLNRCNFFNLILACQLKVVDLLKMTVSEKICFEFRPTATPMMTRARRSLGSSTGTLRTSWSRTRSESWELEWTSRVPTSRPSPSGGSSTLLLAPPPSRPSTARLALLSRAAKPVRPIRSAIFQRVQVFFCVNFRGTQCENFGAIGLA